MYIDLFLLSALSVFSLLHFSNAAVTTQTKKLRCSGIKTRKNWYDLDDSEKSAYIAAFKKLTNNRDQSAVYHQLTKVHWKHGPGGHGVAAFLPWHRYMLSYLEQKLQKQDSSVNLPYWDWSIDAVGLNKSPTLKDFGGLNPGRLNGAFKGLKAFFVEEHFVSRDFESFNNQNLNRAKCGASFFTIARILLCDTYHEMRRQLEQAHGSIHVIVGGDMGDIQLATNDPIFYLHHCFVDKIWWRWQRLSQDKKTSYNGDSPVYERDSEGIWGPTFSDELDEDGNQIPIIKKGAAKPTDPIPGFSGGWRVRDTFETESFCYTYDLSTTEQQIENVLRVSLRSFGSAPGSSINEESDGSVGSDGEKSLAEIAAEAKKNRTNRSFGGFGAPPTASAPIDSSAPIRLGKSADKTKVDQTSQGDFTDDGSWTELFQVCEPSELPESWVQQSNLDPEDVKKVDDLFKSLSTEIHNTDGFISPSSLFNNDKLFLEVAKSVNKFKATVGSSYILLVSLSTKDQNLTADKKVKLVKDLILKKLGIKNVNKKFDALVQKLVADAK